jgi:protein gp37
MLSDFFIEEADLYIDQAWEIIKQHSNLIFVIITKRVHRIKDCLPSN